MTNPLETNPIINAPHGNIPNTPLASATIAFLLGGVFVFGLYASVNDISATASLLTYQLGFFIAAWAFFHWAEFAVTAGWNFEKCSVDCMSFSTACHVTKLTAVQLAYLLDNGSMYHIANGTALMEYLISRYLWPSSKSWPYVSLLGRDSAFLCRRMLNQNRNDLRHFRPNTAFDGYDTCFDELFSYRRVSQAGCASLGN